MEFPDKRQTIFLISLAVLFFLVAAWFLWPGKQEPTKPTIDLNGDGRIDITDYSIFDGRFAREKTPDEKSLLNHIDELKRDLQK